MRTTSVGRQGDGCPRVPWASALGPCWTMQARSRRTCRTERPNNCAASQARRHFVAHLVPAAFHEYSVEQLIVLCQQFTVRMVSEILEGVSRTFNVGKQESDRSGRYGSQNAASSVPLELPYTGGSLSLVRFLRPPSGFLNNLARALGRGKGRRRGEGWPWFAMTTEGIPLWRRPASSRRTWRADNAK